MTVPVGKLSPAQRAIVAIARALDGWTRPDNVLVLDEPTTALHGDEVQVLFEAIRRVASSGAGVVFISHRLDEVLALADRVVVLRDGRVVAEEPASRLDHDTMVTLIAGREVADTTATSRDETGAPVLTVTGISGAELSDFSLTLRRVRSSVSAASSVRAASSSARCCSELSTAPAAGWRSAGRNSSPMTPWRRSRAGWPMCRPTAAAAAR